MGHEKPATDNPAQRPEIQSEVTPANQPQRIGEDQRVLGRDHAAAAESCRGQALEELMPVREVHHVLMGVSEPIELGLAPLRAHRAGVEVLAPKETVNVLKPPAPETNAHAHT